MSLDEAALSENGVPAEAHFLLCGHAVGGNYLGAGRNVETPPFRPRSPCGLLGFLPLTAATMIRSVVTSATVALKLLLWGETLPTWVGILANQTLRRIAAVTLRVPKALAAFALQSPFWLVVRLHLFSQPAEIGETTHFCKIGDSSHRHFVVWFQKTVLPGVFDPVASIEFA